jgi:hypothetical protein
MNAEETEQALIDMWRDAKLLSTAPRHQLQPHRQLLREVHDELTLAVQRMDERETA